MYSLRLQVCPRKLYNKGNRRCNMALLWWQTSHIAATARLPRCAESTHTNSSDRRHILETYTLHLHPCT